MVYYFSDGAASQYKNRKNFLNLCYHQADFGIPAQWHFSATSHGKGACDGLGGTMKRLAARASLQSHCNCTNGPHRQFPLSTSLTVLLSNTKAVLENQFQKSRTVTGTRSLHSFIPVSNDTLETKRYSFSSISKNERVTKQDMEIQIEAVSGYVTCVHNNYWWLGCVIDKDIDNAD